MTGRAQKSLAVVLTVLAVGTLIGFYVAFLTNGPTPYRVPVATASNGGRKADLTLQTVAAVGSKLSPNKNWVSYLVREHGVWHRSTVWTLPANTLVHVTVYNFDGQSGLRNPFLAQARGVGGTFAIPSLGVIVPILGVDDKAPNQCDYAPCPMSNSHETITFTFRTGKAGHYRWQCFVPCAAGFVYGFGGPMQTVGYMDGYVDVV